MVVSYTARMCDHCQASIYMQVYQVAGRRAICPSSRKYNASYVQLNPFSSVIHTYMKCRFVCSGTIFILFTTIQSTLAWVLHTCTLGMCLLYTASNWLEYNILFLIPFYCLAKICDMPNKKACEKGCCQAK